VNSRFASAVFWLGCAVSALGQAEPWRYLVRGPFLLQCREADLKNGERILALMDRTCPWMLADLGLDVPDRLTVIVAASDAEFRGLTGGGLPDWSSAAADRERAVLYLKSPRLFRSGGDFDKTVNHELAHAVLGMATGNIPADRWFEEGFAMLEAGEASFSGTQILVRGFVFGNGLRLSEIEQVLDFRAAQAALSYQAALSAVKYMIERYGPDSVSELVHSLRGGVSMADAMQRATGIPYSRFQADWFRNTKRNAVTLLAFEGSLALGIGMAALLAAAGVATHRRNKKIKRQWMQESDFNTGWTRDVDPENDQAPSPSN